MNGVELIKKVKVMATLLTVKTIVLSASSFDKEQWQEAIQLSDGFLTKPFKVNELFDLMATCLELTWQYQEKDDINLTTDKTSSFLEFVVPPQKRDITIE